MKPKQLKKVRIAFNVYGAHAYMSDALREAVRKERASPGDQNAGIGEIVKRIYLNWLDTHAEVRPNNEVTDERTGINSGDSATVSDGKNADSAALAKPEEQAVEA